MFPLPIGTYIYAVLILISIISFGYGRHEHNKYVEFKAEVIAQAKIQEAKNESIQKQSDLVNKGIKNEYEAKLSAVRNYYAGMQRNTGSGSVSGLSNPTSGTNESPAYYQLAESCSETTVQVVALQDWILQQAGVK